MLQKPSQVVSEQILTLYFRCPSFSSNHLLQRSSYEVSSVFSTASLRLGACGPCFQRLDRPQGPLYSAISVTLFNCFNVFITGHLQYNVNNEWVQGWFKAVSKAY